MRGCVVTRRTPEPRPPRCCRVAIETAISIALDEASEGMADPEVKGMVAYAVEVALAEHAHQEQAA